MRHSVGHVFMKRWIGIVSLFIIWNLGRAQEIALANWRTHFSYNNARILESTETKIFCAVENGLFSIDMEDLSIRKLSKLDGLSAAGITAMHYARASEVMIIGYYSGHIDLIYPDEIINISEVANSSLEGGKQIQSIASENGKVYVGTDLGVIVISLDNKQIAENYIQIGSNGSKAQVSKVHLLEGDLFIQTNEGIQSGHLGDNLLDFNNWTTYPSTESFVQLTKSGDELYAIGEDVLYQYLDEDWITTQIALPNGFLKIADVDGSLFALTNSTIYRLTENQFVPHLNFNSFLGQINDVEAINDQLYFATEQSGLIDQKEQSIQPNGPITDSFSKVKVLGRDVYAFHAPPLTSIHQGEVVDGYSQFVSGRWESNFMPGFLNITDIAAFNDHIYFSSLGYGLYNATDEETIRDIPGSSMALDTIISSIASRDRLWMVGQGEEPIHSLNRDDEWSSLPAASVFRDEFTKVSIASNGIVWTLSSTGDLVVFDPLEQRADLLSSANGIPSSTLDFEIGLEDNVWVGSAKGPALFPSASFIFSDPRALAPSFDSRLLLEGQQINAVITDGGNRVWFGTNNGIRVYDENTTEQVALFNTSNSPLPSDIILSMTYNGTNGEVFIVTDRGMVSYRSASSRGSVRHRNVSVFPNPVRPGYTGLVGISGLAKNVSLKVTDINGNLVQEVQANGGTASWNLMDQNGSQVVTGIYYFFSSDTSGEETYVGKVGVLR